jgi:hypothetical protein
MEDDDAHASNLADVGPILGIRVANGGRYDMSHHLRAVHRISGSRRGKVREREKRAGELASTMWRARRRANGRRTFRLRRQVLMEVQEDN